ncbi:hypothetical protein OF83DRAFT_759682 [Amylostereum chailletii]|nr:hypothetical protein OF83DRAFT_759682 [Amylostereum chailletii]
MSAVLNVKTSLGPILLGGLASLALSGVVTVQAFLYFRVYQMDVLRLKALVALVWAIDVIHTILICSATWKYFVTEYGNANTDNIIMEIALTVGFTATMTFVVHLFFCHRVFRLSQQNWFVTTPLILLTFGRLVAAIASTVEMATLQSYSGFVRDVGWVFTLGLALSSALDILIALVMCYYLRNSRTGFENMDHVIDLIMIYSFNGGALTCIATVVTLVCWLTMPYNLVFLGIHFAISKLYANSLLITLNTRHSLRGQSQPPIDDTGSLPFPSFAHAFRRRGTQQSFMMRLPAESTNSALEEFERDTPAKKGSPSFAPIAPYQRREDHPIRRRARGIFRGASQSLLFLIVTIGKFSSNTRQVSVYL